MEPHRVYFSQWENSSSPVRTLGTGCVSAASSKRHGSGDVQQTQKRSGIKLKRIMERSKGEILVQNYFGDLCWSFWGKMFIPLPAWSSSLPSPIGLSHKCFIQNWTYLSLVMDRVTLPLLSRTSPPYFIALVIPCNNRSNWLQIECHTIRYSLNSPPLHATRRDEFCP